MLQAGNDDSLPGGGEVLFDVSHEHPVWALVVGDNGTGKSTVLKSIALGLCDETSAAGLLKESEQYRRKALLNAA